MAAQNTLTLSFTEDVLAELQAEAAAKGKSLIDFVSQMVTARAEAARKRRAKKQFLKEFDQALKELKLAEEGKVQLRPIDDLINELRVING